ncbi:MAG: ComF family protein [Terrimicrobiaceae bacterium]|jgi:ComF family protein
MPSPAGVLFEPFLSLLYPAHCAQCGRRIAEAEDFCGDCAGTIERIREPRCGVCSEPFDGMAEGVVCPNCRGAAFHFECAVCVVRSRTTIRDLVHRLKYGREAWLARPMGKILCEGLADPRLADFAPDALVPVPLHPRRQRERDFNQSALLALEISRASGVPVRKFLVRRRYTGTQTRLTRGGRRQNLRNAFALRKNAAVADMNLLLVDDVLTTGSTLDACAAVLLEHGAASVRALTLARG